jgi:uncharacterized lipoprotein YajG
MKSITIALLFLTGCSMQNSLKSSTNFKVNTVRKTNYGSIVTFDGKPGRYLLHSDTLKVNDIITMNFVSKL